MRYTNFLTQTPFDINCLTVHGVSSKPYSDNPIGKFGTGLKYAIAIILREGGRITLYDDTHRDTYTFSTTDVTFRGNEFRQVTCKHNSRIKSVWKSIYLPFTLDLGKEWVMWQAFRELYANTLDEGGYVVLGEMKDIPEGYTCITVDSPIFAQIAQQKVNIFPDFKAEEALARTDDIQIYSGGSNHIYFRGMRAYDLDKPAIFTYNVINQDVDLTEDRTIKNIYAIRNYIERAISRGDNENVIKALITPEKEHWESELNFNYTFGHSETFEKVSKAERANSRLNPSVRYHYDTYVAPPKTSKISDASWKYCEEALELARGRLGKRANLVHKVYMEAFKEVMKR